MGGADQDVSIYRISVRSKKWSVHFAANIQEKNARNAKLVSTISAWKNVIIMKLLVTSNFFFEIFTRNLKGNETR